MSITGKTPSELDATTVSDLKSKLSIPKSVPVGSGNLGFKGESSSQIEFTRTISAPTRKNDLEFKGDKSFQAKYIVIGSDTLHSASEMELGLTNKYNSKITHNLISVSVPTQGIIEAVVAAVNLGHEIGDYGLFRASFIVSSPFYNGQPAVGGDGQTCWPPDDHFNENPGRAGYNYFGKLLTEQIGGINLINQIEPAGSPYHIESTVTWAQIAASATYKQYFRNAYSVFTTAYDGGYYNLAGVKCTLIQLLDEYSNLFLATTGSSVGSYNVGTGKYTGGIYTGCATSANHEIWERVIEIKVKFLQYYFGLTQNVFEYSIPGSPSNPLHYIHTDGIHYQTVLHSKTQVINDYCKVPTSRLLDSNNNPINRSYVDVLVDYGYKHVHDAAGISREDGYTATNWNVPYVRNNKYFRGSHLVGQAGGYKLVTNPQSGTGGSWAGQVHSDWMSWLYDNSANFKLFVDKVCEFTAQGIIPNCVIDQRETYDDRMTIENMYKFLEKAGIKTLTKHEAFNLTYLDNSDSNFISNPELVIFQKGIITSAGLPIIPSGWLSGTQYDETTFNSVGTTTQMKLPVYGTKPGSYSFKFKYKGSGTLTVHSILNKTAWNAIHETVPFKTDSLDNQANFTAFESTFDIPNVADNVSADYPEYTGKQDKVIGVVIVFTSSDIRVCKPNLRLT